MRYLRIIIPLVVLLFATSCNVDDFEQPYLPPVVANDCDQVKIAARITRFEDHEVSTRTNKTPEEAFVSSMALAVFPIDGGEVKECISYIHLKGSNLTFTLDRKEIPAKYYDKQFALYIFMNMPNLPATFGELGNKSLAWFKEQAYGNSSIRRPTTGFPMVGSVGDNISADGDGTTFVLMPTRKDAYGNMIPAKDSNGDPIVDSEGNTVAAKITLPLVNGSPKDYIPIPMEALYARFSFEIVVDPDQQMDGGAVPTFTIEKYTINNIPERVHINKNMNDESSVSVANSVTASLSSSTSAGSSIKFEFYLPERFLTPDKYTAETYPYPVGTNGSATIGYSNVREEDQKYCQRYKYDLLADDQLASYITIYGKYLDHQDNTWDVQYNIYLGGDNYGDFNVVRNANYKNKITIRGLNAASDQDGGYVFLDHRVNVNRSLPIIINLHRETKLDSHFEVRPLRIRYPWSEGAIPADAKVTVELTTVNAGDDVSWIRLEHNNGDGVGDNTYCASGKRRYFTTDLVTTTLKNNGQSNGHKVGSRIEIPITSNNNETVWIYVDECNEQAPLDKPNEARKAKLIITYTATVGGVPTTEQIDYVLQQYYLYPVNTTRTASDVTNTTVPVGSYTYYIEHEEEYLHNFDTDDNIGLTENKGMEWGLNGIQLSHLDEAISVTATNAGFDFIASWFGWDKQELVDQAIKSLEPHPYYDYYMVRDITDAESLITPYAYSGLKFNKDIISYLISQYPAHQTVGTEEEKVAKLQKIALDERPKSAIAYCYNKNKRNANGEVTEVKWYLPAVDEIEDIVEWAYGDFDTQFQGNLYWSCQSSYYKYESSWILESLLGGKQTVPGVFYTDNPNRARATRALREGETLADRVNSGDMTYATQSGSIYAPLWGNPTITMDSPVANGSYRADCFGYDGNRPRKGYQARVRCVRAVD